MKRISAVLLVSLIFSINAAAQTRQPKTVTNADLERFRRERLKTDPDDETERRRLGLPSRAEQERERLAEQQELSALATRIRREQAQKENYWREQTFGLRSKIFVVEAEINYIRAQINEIPAPQTYYSIGYLPYYGNCCFGGRTQTDIMTGGIGGAVAFGRRPQIVLRAGYGKTTIRQSGSIIVRANGFGSPQTSLSFGKIPSQPGTLVAPFASPNYDNLTREELRARLRILEQTRAGLLARFELLADEARRDGVRID